MKITTAQNTTEMTGSVMGDINTTTEALRLALQQEERLKLERKLRKEELKRLKLDEATEMGPLILLSANHTTTYYLLLTTYNPPMR